MKPYKVVAEFYSIICPCALSPLSRATDAERIPRSRFRNVNADSHSAIILVTEDGSVDSDPTDTAACESRRFLKFHKNCQRQKTVLRCKFQGIHNHHFVVNCSKASKDHFPEVVCVKTSRSSVIKAH